MLVKSLTCFCFFIQIGIKRIKVAGACPWQRHLSKVKTYQFNMILKCTFIVKNGRDVGRLSMSFGDVLPNPMPSHACE